MALLLLLSTFVTAGLCGWGHKHGKKGGWGHNGGWSNNGGNWGGNNGGNNGNHGGNNGDGCWYGKSGGKCGHNNHGDSERPIDTLEYQVNFVDHEYNEATDETVYNYEITTLSGGSPLRCKKLKYWVLGVPSCMDLYTIRGEPEFIEFALDEATNTTGVKWDQGLNVGSTGAYSVYVSGHHPLTNVSYSVKGGTYYGRGTIEGPSCDEVYVPKDCPAYESTTTYCNATLHGEDADCHCLCNCVNECWVGDAQRTCNDGNWTGGFDCQEPDVDLPCLDLPQNITIPASVECMLIPVSLNQPFEEDIKFVTITNPRPDQVTFSSCMMYFLKDTWDVPQSLEVCFSARGGAFWPENFPIDLQCAGEPLQDIYLMRQPAPGAYAMTYADPHLYTYDGLEYDNFYAGDFWFTRHLDGIFSVTVRQRKCFEDWQFDGGCNYGVAVQFKSSVVFFELPSSGSPSDPSDPSPLVMTKAPSDETLVADGVTVVWNTPMDTYWVYIDDMPDLFVMVDLQSIPYEDLISSRYLDITVQVPEVFRGQLWGQAGNFNGAVDNLDNVDRNGVEQSNEYLPSVDGHSSVLREDLHFLVTDEENLFFNHESVPLVAPLENLGGVIASSGTLNSCGDEGLGAVWRTFLTNAALNLPPDVYSQEPGQPATNANDGNIEYARNLIFSSLFGDKTVTAYWRVQFPELQTVHYIQYWNTLDYQTNGYGSFPVLRDSGLQKLWENDRIRHSAPKWHFFPEVPTPKVAYGEWRQFFKFTGKKIQILEIEFWCEPTDSLRLKRSENSPIPPTPGSNPPKINENLEDSAEIYSDVTSLIPTQDGAFKPNVPENNPAAKRGSRAVPTSEEAAQLCNAVFAENSFGQVHPIVARCNQLGGEAFAQAALAQCIGEVQSGLLTFPSIWTTYYLKACTTTYDDFYLDDSEDAIGPLVICHDLCGGVGICNGEVCTCQTGYSGEFCEINDNAIETLVDYTILENNIEFQVVGADSAPLCQIYTTNHEAIGASFASTLVTSNTYHCSVEGLTGYFYFSIESSSADTELIEGGYFYRSANNGNACTENPCLNGGECQTDYSSAGFYCTCTEQFTSAYCDDANPFYFSTEIVDHTGLYVAAGVLGGMLALTIAALVGMGLINRSLSKQLADDEPAARKPMVNAESDPKFDYEMP